MAPREATLLLCAAVLLLSTGSVHSAPEGTDFLGQTIQDANQFAEKCKGKQKCLGLPVEFTSFVDILLDKPLPALAPGAYLIFRGKCKGSKGSRCFVDGAGKFPIFSTNTTDGLAPAKLEISNIVFRNANGGVFQNLNANLNVTKSIFLNNTRGVELGQPNIPGGLPTRTFTDCEFTNNNGTVILAGLVKWGLASSKDRIAYVIKDSKFTDNKGQQNGGAVSLTGSGTSIFQNVKFQKNTAGGSGGAVYLDETTAIFRSTTFSRNVALTGKGGAVAGTSGFFNALSVSFCSSSFSKNLAPKNLSSPTLSFDNYKPNPLKVIFCGTDVPKGSSFPFTKYTGTKCPKSGC